MKPGILVYHATAGADKVVYAGKCILHRIIIGKDVASAIVEVSDHASDGDGNVNVYLEGSTLQTAHGTIEINAEYKNGICADLTNQTNVMFIYSPLT